MLLFAPFCLLGQNFFFRQYIASDGLPSNVVYSFDQDSHNLLWLGTGNGLCYFDGNVFKNYSIEDGLINNLVYSLTVDHLDRKWMSTLARKPSYFENGRGKVPAWADTISVSNYLFHSVDTFLWFSGRDIKQTSRYRPLGQITSDLQFLEYPDLEITRGAYGIRVDSVLYFTNNSTLVKYQNKEFSAIEGMEVPLILEFCQALGHGLICKDRTVRNTNRIVYIDLEQKKLNYWDHLEEYTNNNTINAILVDSKNQLWIGMNQGILFIKDWQAKQTAVKLLEHVFVSDIYEDHENNIWVGTEGNGIFFLVSSIVQSLKKIDEGENRIIRTMETSQDGRIFLGFTDGSIEVYDQKLELIFSKKLAESRIVDIIPRQDKLWVACNNEVYELDKNFKELGTYRSKFPIKSLGWLGDQLYVFSYKIEVLVGQQIQLKNAPIRSRIYSNYTLNDSTILLGTTEGLYHLSGEQVRPLASKEIFSDVRGLAQDANGQIWVATAGQGIFILAQEKMIRHITENDGLSSNICTHLYLDEEYAWVSTNDGINKVDLNTFQIQGIGEQDGLSNKEIKYLSKSNDLLVAASSNGVDLIPDTIRSFSATPSLFIEHIVAEGDTLAPAEKYALPYNQNDLFIQIQGISYKSLGDLTYAYQLVGLDKNWIETTSQTLNWSAIPPGNYTLQIRVKGRNGKWSEIEKITFKIDQPWWQKPWFLILSLLAISGLLIYIYRRQKLNYQKETEIQKRMQKLQLNALRAQMNPHFMFNALSSIQEYINRSDLKAANQFLSRFASLVRSVLNHATREKISLQEEITQISLYLKLENLRFNQKIAVDLSVDPLLNPLKTYIPTMLIQPFVENALVHGLFHKKGDKSLHISFTSVQAGIIECQIRDNGIGRKKAAIINRGKRYKSNSIGIPITKDRLQLILAPEFKDKAITIIDMEDNNKESQGTIVKILIPYGTSKSRDEIEDPYYR